MTTTGAQPGRELPSLGLPALAELARLRRWVCWRYASRDGKRTKVPITPDGSAASTTDPDTWSSFDDCARAHLEGIGDGLGFVFAKADGYFGVDLDGCVRDDRSLEPWAAEIVAELATYTERSPSGRGLHVIGRGQLPEGGRKRGSVEMYQEGRYFTVTGHRWPGAPETLEERTAALAAFHRRIFGAHRTNGSGSSSVGVEPRRAAELSAAVIAVAHRDERIRRLFKERHEALGYPSESEADLALANLLAREGVSAAELEAALRWRRRGARKDAQYFRRTVEKALEGAREARGDDAGADAATKGTAPAPSASDATGQAPGEPERPLVGEDQGERPTDTGNAKRFVRLHGTELRYCRQLGAWFVYDGRRFAKDETGEAERRAEATVATIYAEAARAGSAEQRTGLARWAERSESAERIRALLTRAETQAELAIRQEDLDADPLVLNVHNGTLDLRSLVLREHRREDLLTKLAPVDFDPAARSELWERVLERAMPDPPARRFAQKAAGQTLLGHGHEDLVILAHGPTRTAKGTVQDAISAALGDYAATAELDLLAERERAGGPRPELARLRGVRLVAIYESGRRLRLSTALLKTLSGGDPITVRDLYGKPFTFRPQFTLWIATNARPRVPDDDGGVWERLREIPFVVQIPPAERDPRVRAELADPAVSGAAVLAWLVEGLRLYRAEGLRPPTAVEDATREYREEMDPLRDFLAERCVRAPGAFVSSANLRQAYDRWCQANGERPCGAAPSVSGCETSDARRSAAPAGGAGRASGSEK